MSTQAPSSLMKTSPAKNGIRIFLGWLLAYILIAAGALGANPLDGQTVGPFDILPSYSGWNATGQVVAPRHLERSDILDSLMPLWLQGREQIREGQLPLWNPLRAGGTPGLVDPTNSMLTLPFAIFAAAPDPATGFYLAVLACLVVAGLGMHYLVRRYHGSFVALFAGVSFMMCGFVTAWLFWPHMYTAMWIPWLMLAVDDYVRRGRFRAVSRIAIFTALLFLGGFPFVVAIGLGAALVIALCCSLEFEPGNTVPNLIGVIFGVALGLALSALPLLTLIDSLQSTDLSQRSFGSGLTLREHVRLLSWPWAQQSAHVETNMYTGMILLISAACTLVLMLFKPRCLRALTWCGLFFVVVGAGLVFQLLPREIGGHLPVLSNNPWSRAILLLNIGLILMAVASLAWMQSRVKLRMVGIVLMLALCMVQFVDLRSQFKRFNGPTDAALFFPVSPELDMLKRRIRPFQYVGQDSNAFMVSGTLGSIGLGEWYAHSMRSTALQLLLGSMAKDPFTTPTATQITLDRFHWSDPLLDAVGLCYGVSADARAQWAELVKSTGKQRTALPPINNIMVRQLVRIEATTVVPAITLRMATYTQSGLDGSLRVRLVPAGTEAGQEAWIDFPMADVRDNSYVTFKPTVPIAVTPGNYEIQLAYKPGKAGKNLTAWRFSDAPGEVMHADTRLPGALEYIISRQDGTSLTALTPGKRIVVSENPGCAKGPYFVQKSSIPDPLKWESRSRLTSYRPDRFMLSVDAPSQGYVVVPMQYQNGWSATVNGVPVPLRLVAGVMPAVAVMPGAASVEMKYRPPRFRLGVALTFVALLLLGASAWPARRRKPVDPEAKPPKV